MSVTAKFIVDATLTRKHSDKDACNTTVSLQADTSGKGNDAWSKYTPSGTIEMQITNPAAAAFFTVGKAVLITFDDFDLEF